MKASLKKEFLESYRTHKCWIYLAIAGGCLIFGLVSILSFKLLEVVVQNNQALQEQMEGLLAMFEMTYSNSVYYFLSMMGTYYVIGIAILMMSVVSKEIKAKKWILPIASGIKPQHMIASKLIVHLTLMIASLILVSALNLLITVCFFEADIAVTDMLFCYGMMIVYMAFIGILTITINAISKKGWLTCLIAIAVAILGPMLLGIIPVGEGMFLDSFSPFLFYNAMMSINPLMGQTGINATWYQWLSAGVSMLLICTGLIIWAVKSSKITAKSLI